ncbi:zinc finger protein 853-like [Atheta coriaria]|uniref:zinc finger protein 853-like n=1 Tax=Dalotia coriaria TaxID=877792 RepID=UPI0031F438D8
MYSTSQSYYGGYQMPQQMSQMQQQQILQQMQQQALPQQLLQQIPTPSPSLQQQQASFPYGYQTQCPQQGFMQQNNPMQTSLAQILDPSQSSIMYPLVQPYLIVNGQPQPMVGPPPQLLWSELSR